MIRILGEPAVRLPSCCSRLRFRSIRHLGVGRLCAATITLALVLLTLGCTKTKTVALDEQTVLALEELDRQNSIGRAVEQEDGTVLDYDLTKMNANMVYAQIFNLMLSPEEYANKTFKMQGDFLKLTNPAGQTAYAVIIKDALACCTQGLEFKYDFGQNEPQDGQQLTVIGTYTLTKTQEGMSYSYLTAKTVDY